MLVLVKKPHIELSIHGDSADELLAWIRKKYAVAVLSAEDSKESISIESTDFWKRMEKNRIGNLLAGARHRAGLTQTQLAKRLGIRQNMVSDFERGRRSVSPSMAGRFSEVLDIKKERLLEK